LLNCTVKSSARLGTQTFSSESLTAPFHASLISLSASAWGPNVEKTLEEKGNGRQTQRPGVLGGLAQALHGKARAAIDALGQSHSQQLVAIVESTDDAIISKDLDGIIATWNKGAEKLFGYEAAEVIGLPITILFPPELQDEEAGILARIKRGERIEHYETVRQRKDGRRIPISLTVSPIQDSAGQIVGASKIARDISSRKRVEETQAALYDFTNRLFRAESTDDIYEAALDAIVRALGCDRASILLFDDAGVMKFVACRGLSAGYQQEVEGHSPWTRDSKDPEPIIIRDIDTAEMDPSLRATIKAEGISALAFIPLAAKGGLVGKFMTYYAIPHNFSQADISVAVTIARQLGFGLERLRTEERRREAEEAKELLLNESKHRIKNTLATVQAMAGQTLHHTRPDELQAFLARLHALGEAHELLTTEDWNRAALREVVSRALKPFASNQSNRIVVDGPSIWVPANTSLNLTLCLHELATNAVKYGALCNATGQVRVAWDVAGDGENRKLYLTWQETGGPPVTAPLHKGFGSLLIRATGEVDTRIDFHPDGLRCLIDLTL
jgi:PAS domain S-box-containing protein